jgi:bifunctional N-acetylglucosamine-1-phosphate-uridyltransferase/glucosamine-1-phosphate-acetyltransferase GlmU-like protein
MTSTLIVPAAGFGVRLGKDLPKGLVPIMDRPIFIQLLLKCKDLFDEYIVVVPSGWKNQFEIAYKQETDLRPYSVTFVEQSGGKGTGYAIKSCFPFLNKGTVVVCWADQLGVTKDLFSFCNLQFKDFNVDLMLPVVKKLNPYVSVENIGRGIRFYQTLEEVSGQSDLSDCGVFYFKSQFLEKILTSAETRNMGLTVKSEEFHLLNIIQDFNEFYRYELLLLEDEKYSFGVNTIEEFNSVEERFKHDKI